MHHKGLMSLFSGGIKILSALCYDGGQNSMNVYEYALISYGITIVVSFLVMGIVVGLNKLMNKFNITDDEQDGY